MFYMAKYYVVWQGYKPGVYVTWADAQAQIQGFPGARFQSYPNRMAAEEAFATPPPPPKTAQKAAAKVKSNARPSRSAIIRESLSVDAACSGNPGPMEYQGVHTQSKERIFHLQFPLGTNNIGEFLAIVHGIALLQKQGLHHYPIYTDSVTAIKWVKQKKAKTLLERNAKTENLYQMIERAELWLHQHSYSNPILKWETEFWGEIPADFGRK